MMAAMLRFKSAKAAPVQLCDHYLVRSVVSDIKVNNRSGE